MGRLQNLPSHIFRRCQMDTQINRIGRQNSLYKNSLSDKAVSDKNYHKIANKEARLVVLNNLSESAKVPMNEEANAEILKVIGDDKYDSNNTLHFEVHEPTGQLMAVVKNLVTGDIVKTVPPEELLDVLSKIKTSMNDFVGSLVNRVG
ncbi:MAG: hypothetical protein GF372_08600 [Candidatus Marinimicrobia bacterium]|nr:hypothetical protein [Candidatus Neomarinimicrobiota bacterium]